MPVDSVPGLSSFPGLQTAVLLLCPHVALPLCAYGEGALVSLPLLIRTPAYQIRVLPLLPLLTLIASSKALSSNIVMLGVRASKYKFGGVGDTVQSMTLSK